MEDNDKPETTDSTWTAPAAAAPAAAAPASAQPAPPSAQPAPAPSPSSFPASRWEPPRRAPRAAVLGSVLGSALLAAATITLDRPGLGWLLTGLALVGVAGAATVEYRHRLSVGRWLWALAGIALLAVGAVRAAGWLYLLCVPMAGICAVQALVGGETLRVMAAGVLSGPVAALRALAWGGRGARRLAPGGQPRAMGGLLLSVGVSALLLLVFGALLASADHTFARLLAQLIPDISVSRTPTRVALFAVVAVGGLATAYLIAAPPQWAEPAEPTRPLRLIEWALPVALLDVLFTAFVLVQLAALFGGRAHVLGPGGPNFAQYARGGFWQLLAVTALTLAVIGVVAWAAPRTGRADRAAIRVLTGTLAVLTLVIVASALMRIALYAEVYGYTRLRLAVAVTELWLGLIFMLVLLAGVRLRARWLPRAVLASAVAGLLALAVLDPDRFIAGQNVDRFERTGQLDVSYLSGLSPDAAPELARLPEGQRACALTMIAGALDGERDSWYSFNLGRSRARAIPAPVPCASP